LHPLVGARFRGPSLPWADTSAHSGGRFDVIFAGETCGGGGHVCRGQEVVLTPSSNVAILGFGARAEAFAALLAPRGCALRAWDPELGGGNSASLRSRIEAAGVDAAVSLGDALRGARLVVVDVMPPADLHAHLQPGQQVLDLGSATDGEVDIVLLALGLPAAAASWKASAAARDVANSAPMDCGTQMVRRGELP
jgi:3-hydroxyisobutyrate dehydrogenase-like beta-hydroxyacid dehydrogenase